MYSQYVMIQTCFLLYSALQPNVFSRLGVFFNVLDLVELSFH